MLGGAIEEFLRRDTVNKSHPHFQPHRPQRYGGNTVYYLTPPKLRGKDKQTPHQQTTTPTTPWSVCKQNVQRVVPPLETWPNSVSCHATTCSVWLWRPLCVVEIWGGTLGEQNFCGSARSLKSTHTHTHTLVLFVFCLLPWRAEQLVGHRSYFIAHVLPRKDVTSFLMEETG